jgi:hypothetical protein
MEVKMQTLAIIKEAFAQTSKRELIGDLIGVASLFGILFCGLFAVLVWG